MDLYVIRRRSNWGGEEALEATAAKSSAEGEKMSEEVRWIRSYVVQEDDGQLGTVCIYEAVSPEALKKHADKAELAFSEVRPIVDTVVVRPDVAK